MGRTSRARRTRSSRQRRSGGSSLARSGIRPPTAPGRNATGRRSTSQGKRARRKKTGDRTAANSTKIVPMLRVPHRLRPARRRLRRFRRRCRSPRPACPPVPTSRPRLPSPQRRRHRRLRPRSRIPCRRRLPFPRVRKRLVVQASRLPKQPGRLHHKNLDRPLAPAARPAAAMYRLFCRACCKRRTWERLKAGCLPGTSSLAGATRRSPCRISAAPVAGPGRRVPAGPGRHADGRPAGRRR